MIFKSIPPLFPPSKPQRFCFIVVSVYPDVSALAQCDKTFLLPSRKSLAHNNIRFHNRYDTHFQAGIINMYQSRFLTTSLQQSLSLLS